MQLLLAHKADPTIVCGADGQTALHFACQVADEAHSGCVEMLLEVCPL